LSITVSLQHAARLSAAAMVSSLAVCLAACSEQPQPKPQLVGQFTGSFDPQSDQIVITPVAAASPDPGSPGLGLSPAVAPVINDQNGVAGAGSDDTVELVTEAIRAGPAGCGRENSLCADVTLRSFFKLKELHNIFIELTVVSSSDNYGFNSVSVPAAGILGGATVSNLKGLWSYPALGDFTRGKLGGDAPGINAATQTWYFGNPSNVGFTFVGRIMAEQVTPATTGLTGTSSVTCGTTATAVTTSSSCGECGRSTSGTCAYATVSNPATQAQAKVAFSPCAAGQTACGGGSFLAYACRNLQTETGNCGACGRVCGTGLTCLNGTCTTATACVTGSRCGTGCCPAGTTCEAGICILTDADEVAVGAEHACATTATTTRRPSQVVDVNSGTQTLEHNVVCWGRSWMSSAFYPNSPVPTAWSAGVSLPAYDGNSKTLDVIHGLSAGGTITTGRYLPVGVADPGVETWGYMLPYADQFPKWVVYQHPAGTATGGNHLCSFDRTIDHWVECWGDNRSGQAGIGLTSTSVTTIANPRPLIQVLEVGAAAGSGKCLVADQIAAAGDTTCAILDAPALGTPNGNHGTNQTAGTVACWGADTGGKAGGTGAGNFSVPVLVKNGATALAGALLSTTPGWTRSSIAVGGSHAVALLGDNTLAFWGSNTKGQFGNGGITKASNFEIVSPGSGTPRPAIRGVAAGQDFTCYFDANGAVFCAGANDKGQLGDGTTTERHTFVKVLGLSGVTMLSAGGVPRTPQPPETSATYPAGGSACALASGRVYCWGANSSGQLGAGASGPFYPVPQPVRMAPL
jgi:hypothetical protein